MDIVPATISQCFQYNLTYHLLHDFLLFPKNQQYVEHVH